MSAASPAALILTRADIAGLMAPEDWVEAVEIGFAALAEGRAYAPPPMALEGSGGTFHAKGAALRLDRPYAVLKLNGNFPGNRDTRGLPTIQGAVLLCDGESGSLLAIMDSMEVTLRRTAAATALAARFLARRDSRTILICGCGDQGAAQVKALRRVLPLEKGYAWDLNVASAATLAQSETGIAMEVATDLAAAAAASDVIVTCTTARSPFLEASFVRPGTFVAAVGADSPEKSELHPEVMRGATVVTDIADQCAAMGDLNHAIAAGAMTREDVHAELAELVAGTKAGRGSPDEITVFDSTGSALQDCAAAATIFRRAVDAGHGRSIRLGE
jgi:ornithine cyclodeaminase/alanine dehydrogenase-like protein (mu-crystallin family)